MTSLVAAAAAFAAIHLLVSGTRIRDALVQRLGEGAYRGLFSLASAVLLGWFIWAYGQARHVTMTPLFDYRLVAAALMLVAVVFVVLGLVTPGPAVVGGERLLARGITPTGIHRITRHPFLWGVALWAAVHAAYNPDPVSGVFFGTFLIVAVAGTFSIDAKRARLYGAAWDAYARQSSNIPFAAIVQGRTTLAWREITPWKPAIAVAAFIALVYFHGALFGIPLAHP